MSNHKVIRDADQTLRETLWAGLRHDPEIFPAVFAGVDQITIEPPAKLLQDTTPNRSCLSLFLYRVVENGEMKNRPLQPTGSGVYRPPPLSLNLFYLITPLVRDSGQVPDGTDQDHRVLGRVMQVFYDHAILRGSALQGDLGIAAEELRLILHPAPLEDLTKLWSAWMRPYRLSVAYEVKVAFINSDREERLAAVRRKRMEFQMAGTR
jgi:Pvc16 N-terminal domain